MSTAPKPAASKPGSTFRLAGGVLSALLLLGPARPAAAEASRSQPARASARSAPAPEDVGTRVQRLHDQLGITPDQEVLWKPIAAAMQDNAKTIAAAMQARSAKAQTMNALDDIMTYEAIAAAHAAGLKDLAAAFAPLYSAMPPAQQRNADAVFGHKLKSGQKE